MSSVLVRGIQETPAAAITGTATEVKIRVSVYASQNVPMTGTIKVTQLAAVAAY
jgi:hypothetical protein